MNHADWKIYDIIYGHNLVSREILRLSAKGKSSRDNLMWVKLARESQFDEINAVARLWTDSKEVIK